MSVILKHCEGGNSSRNTGAKKQCLEGLTDRMYAAKKGFKFASVADFESKAKWLEAIAAKNIVPFYKAYELTAENTEATVYETGDFVYETAPAVKKTSFESYLGFCSHRAMKSYNDSTEYTQIFESTNKGEFIGVSEGDGVKGQDVSIRVGIRNIATKDKPAYTKVSLTFDDYNQLEDNPVVIKTGFLSSDLDGIYDLKLTQVSASATSIEFTASVGCTAGEDKITSLVSANVVVKNVAGAVVDATLVPADSNGVYTLTGTGFAKGFTVNVNGVVTIVDISYEAEAPLVITGSTLLPVITSANSLDITNGVPGTFQVTYTNGPAVAIGFTGAVSPPFGVTISNSGLISWGNSVGTGVFVTTIVVVNNDGPVQQAFTINVT